MMAWITTLQLTDHSLLHKARKSTELNCQSVWLMSSCLQLIAGHITLHKIHTLHNPITLTRFTLHCCAGTQNLPCGWWHREPALHVAEHSGCLLTCDAQLHTSHFTAQGVCLWLSCGHWREAVLCGWWEWYRLVQLHAAAIPE